MRGGGERLSFIHPCVSYSLVWRDRKKKKKWEVAGTEGSRERERDVCVCVCGGGGELKTVPLCWQVLDDSSDIKVFSLTGELLS